MFLAMITPIIAHPANMIVSVYLKGKVLDIREEFQAMLQDWERKWQQSELTITELTATVDTLKADIQTYKER